MKLNAIAACAALTLAAPAFAGSPAPAPADPLLPAPAAWDWTGPYVGIELGFGDGTANGRNARFNGDGMLYGVIAGYDRDMGNWVLGVGLDYDFADITVGAVNVESLARLKLRAGADLGRGLLYGTAGVARAVTAASGTDTGWVAGIGYEQMVGDNWSLGAEALYHEFNNFAGGGFNVEATTISLRAAYRF